MLQDIPYIGNTFFSWENVSQFGVYLLESFFIYIFFIPSYLSYPLIIFWCMCDSLCVILGLHYNIYPENSV